MNRQTRKRQTRNHTTETYRQNENDTGRETGKEDTRDEQTDKQDTRDEQTDRQGRHQR